MPPTARAETVGSLLRPRHVFDSRAEVRDGKKTPAELKPPLALDEDLESR